MISKHRFENEVDSCVEGIFVSVFHFYAASMFSAYIVYNYSHMGHAWYYLQCAGILSIASVFKSVQDF